MQLAMEYQLLIKERSLIPLWTQSWVMSVTARRIVAATQNKKNIKLIMMKKAAASRRDANQIWTALKTCRWAFRLTSSTTSWPWLSNVRSFQAANSIDNQSKSIPLQTSSESQSRAQLTVKTLISSLKYHIQPLWAYKGRRINSRRALAPSYCNSITHILMCLSILAPIVPTPRFTAICKAVTRATTLRLV